MYQTHLHLLITHLPIFGSIIGGFVLAYEIKTKSNRTKIAAYLLLIISSLGAVIAFATGEAAEETAEKIQGVSKIAIEEHADFAIFALIALIILGLSSAVGLFLTLKQSPMIKKIAWFTFFISVISFSLVLRTGYLGGQIRHTELNSSVSIPSLGGEHDEHGDKDDHDDDDKD